MNQDYKGKLNLCFKMIHLPLTLKTLTNNHFLKLVILVTVCRFRMIVDHYFSYGSIIISVQDQLLFQLRVDENLIGQSILISVDNRSLFQLTINHNFSLRMMPELWSGLRKAFHHW